MGDASSEGLATKFSAKPPAAKFTLISTGAGPRTCAHVCVAVGRRLFIHGGKSTPDPSAKDVKNDLWIFHLDEKRWEDITDDHSPFLSQHCAQVSRDGARLFLVGGWNGHHRTFDVHSFLIETRSWEAWTTSGFPIGAGLSSFAIVPLASSSSSSSSSMAPETDELTLVLGREGGLRTQRRSGNAYLLRSFICGQSKYEPFPHGTASRSGHTATPLDSNPRVVLIGGRDDKPIEMLAGVKPRRNEYLGETGDDATDPMKSFVEKVKACPTLVKDPPSRQRHVAIPLGDNSILIHGGETFNGKSKMPVNDLYVVSFGSITKGKPSPVAKWVKIGVAANNFSPNLAAHSAVVLPSKEIFIFGGFQAKTAVDHCYQLELL